MAIHHFKRGSFKKELWIDKKTVYTKPVGVDVEFTTAGAFEWVFADRSGRVVRTLSNANHNGGWKSVDFASLGMFGDYSIGFRNASSGKQRIKHGDVHLP